MGDGIGFECKNCDYKFDAYEGIGFMFGDLMNLIERIPKKERDSIIKLVHEYNISTQYTGDKKESAYYENRVFVHPESGRFSIKLYVELYNPVNGELLYKTDYKTKNGKEYIQPPIEQMKDYPCPKCKNKSLIDAGIFLWD
jgi:hypothetical protein